MTKLRYKLAFALAALIFAPTTGQTRDLGDSLGILPVALQLSSVKKFIIEVPRDLVSVSVAGRGCAPCGGEAPFREDNYIVTLHISFADAEQKSGTCSVFLDIPAHEYHGRADDGIDLLDRVKIDEHNSTPGCATGN